MSSNNTPVHDTDSQCKVQLQKIQRFRICLSLLGGFILNLCCDTNLAYSNPVFSLDDVPPG